MRFLPHRHEWDELPTGEKFMGGSIVEPRCKRCRMVAKTDSEKQAAFLASTRRINAILEERGL